MKTTLRTDLTVKDICSGFVYNEFEGKGLYGWGGKLTIQPEYQRNYIYADGKKDVSVVESLIAGYPIGLMYFVKVSDDKYEVLDGQQRITSFGRFVTGKLAVQDANGFEQVFSGTAKNIQDKILNAPLTIYICEGTESEIKEWFQVVNIAGVPLNSQELLNSIYSGPFVTLAREEFSNSQSAMVQKWQAYIRGDVKRQEILAEALSWVSKGHTELYMSKHRYDKNITGLKTYFNAVIDWASAVFTDVESIMRGQPWGEFYERFHTTAYDPQRVHDELQTLLEDDCVTDRRGIIEYILGGSTDTRLLNIRVFDMATKKTAYARQTREAEKTGVSNCPLCAIGHDARKSRVYRFTEMEADHVKAWSTGGNTDISNCEMLCITHNRAKGNR